MALTCVSDDECVVLVQYCGVIALKSAHLLVKSLGLKTDSTPLLLKDFFKCVPRSQNSSIQIRFIQYDTESLLTIVVFVMRELLQRPEEDCKNDAEELKQDCKALLHGSKRSRDRFSYLLRLVVCSTSQLEHSPRNIDEPSPSDYAPVIHE